MYFDTVGIMDQNVIKLEVILNEVSKRNRSIAIPPIGRGSKVR